MTHIGKNLAEEGRLSDSIAQILDDMDSEPRPRTRLRTRTRRTSSRVPRRETGVQTVNDLVTDEAPEFAARPPPCKKREMIPSMAVFQDVDRIALQVGTTHLSQTGIYTSLACVVIVILGHCYLFLLRKTNLVARNAGRRRCTAHSAQRLPKWPLSFSAVPEPYI